MNYDEWKKMKEFEEETSPYQSLYDSIGKTVKSMYKDVDPADFVNRMYERDRNKKD